MPPAELVPTVNDIHSSLNATEVHDIIPVASVGAARDVVRDIAAGGGVISVAGGRHAMGGQQFATGSTLLDTRAMNAVLGFDRDRGLIEVEAGIQWPGLIDFLITTQADTADQWGIRQKQTGADRFTIGGSISANCHGRALTMSPIAADVESFTLIAPDASLIECDREHNSELFRLALGGYGLFGVIATVTLRLAPRIKLERIVEMTTTDELAAAFAHRITDGFMYGDFQFSIDPKSADFLKTGVFSCYRPVDPATPIAADPKGLQREDWQELLSLAHTDKARAFEAYSRHYLATNKQIYWSDLHQLADYEDGYHQTLDRLHGAKGPASEMITELYVPITELRQFMTLAADDFRRHGTEVIYGTIRLIRRDEDTYMPWARQDYACVIFNLHTVHTKTGIAQSRAAFCRLIDIAIALQGSYYLTYHRWATNTQLETCYPQFNEFLRLKRQHDPDEIFRSDWYRHYCRLASDASPLVSLARHP